MSELEQSRPVTTVATIVDRDGAFLLVEEETRAGMRLNQPAGHLEAGETLVAAAIRETLEETGCRVVPDRARRHLSLGGAGQRRDVHPLRVRRRRRGARAAAPARRGHPARALAVLRRDRRAPRPSTAARSSCAASTITAPACGGRSISSRSCDGTQAARDRRHVGRRRLVGRRVAAEAAGLRRRRPLHEELGGRRHRRILHVARGSGRRGGGRRRDRHRARGGQLRRRVSRARVRAFPARVRGGPHAESRRAVQQRDQVPRVPRPRAARSAPTASRPATTRACAATGRARRTAEGAGRAPRTRATSCIG